MNRQFDTKSRGKRKVRRTAPALEDSIRDDCWRVAMCAPPGDASECWARND